MSGRKRTAVDTSTSSNSKNARRQVTITTFNKWKTQYERDYQTLSWMRCNIDQQIKTLVDILWCEACKKEGHITGMKNFSKSWINGSMNHKTSNIIDHANSDQHKAAMMRVRSEAAKASNLPITSYSPIARSLLVMDEAVQGRMKRKFDICYVMAKESVAFRKYTSFHELEERHGIELGFAYKTQDSAKKFIHYFAESQRQLFFKNLFSTSHFYSFLMDGSTDAGNIEDELVLIQYCARDDFAQEIRSCAWYLSLEVPMKGDAEGLIRCLGNALQLLGVDNILNRSSVLGVQDKPILIGGGTDGASVNIAEQNGMKGKLQNELPWLYWTWCYAHRLELACKNALCSKLFNDINEELIRLFSLYSKSPKKSRELVDIVEDLKQVWEFSGGGYLPVRSQGSRWINHKRKALQRLVDRYGAYLNHVITLTEDQSINVNDRARLKGYLKKWNNSKMIIGAAMYVDLLKPVSLLSLTLQAEKLGIVLGIQHLLKSTKSLKTMAGQDPLLWPTVKLVCSRVKENNDGENTYQGAVLKNYNPSTLKACSDQALADITRLQQTMRSRLEWSDVNMLRSILVVLDTRSWHCSSRSETEEDDNLKEIREAVEFITSHFREPLEAKGVCLASIQYEIEEIVPYARSYLNIGTEGYQRVWYKLHTSPDAAKWSNILHLCELLFSLPFSNGHVERMFSSLKIIKTERRTNLKSSTLSDLLDIQMEGPPLSQFSPDHAVSLWWDDCKTTRRVSQAPRKEYRPRENSSLSSSQVTTTDTGAEGESTMIQWRIQGGFIGFHGTPLLKKMSFYGIIPQKNYLL